MGALADELGPPLAEPIGRNDDGREICICSLDGLCLGLGSYSARASGHPEPLALSNRRVWRVQPLLEPERAQH